MSIASRVVSSVPWSRLVGVERRTVNLAAPPAFEKVNKSDLLRLQMFIKDCETEYSYTPDWSILEQSEYQPVFIYCNMMHGGAQHPVLDGLYKSASEDGLSINPYVYTKTRYEVWQTNQGRESVPVALTSRRSAISFLTGTLQTLSRPAPIKGRLFFVRSSVIKDLDKAKQNGVIFRRRKVPILLPYMLQVVDPVEGYRQYTTGHSLTSEQVYEQWAWMYLGRHKHWDELLDGGYTTIPCELRSHILKQRKGVSYFRPKKTWLEDENYYFFNAKGVNTNK